MTKRIILLIFALALISAIAGYILLQNSNIHLTSKAVGFIVGVICGVLIGLSVLFFARRRGKE